MNKNISNSGIIRQPLSIGAHACRTLIVMFALLSFGLGSSGQKAKTTSYSNSSMSFDTFMSGVKYVEIGLNAHNQELVDWSRHLFIWSGTPGTQICQDIARQ